MPSECWPSKMLPYRCCDQGREICGALDTLKAWKSCNELTFWNMFMPVFKRSDPGTLYIISCHTHRIRILHKSQSKEHTFRPGAFVYSKRVDYPPNTSTDQRLHQHMADFLPWILLREVFLNQGNLPHTYRLWLTWKNPLGPGQSEKVMGQM